jgi:hypothetical protein
MIMWGKRVPQLKTQKEIYLVKINLTLINFKNLIFKNNILINYYNNERN